ncbi:MAG: hypothetical protein ACR2M9_04605 [Cyanophyceae cyanobacterium]
MSIYKNKNWRTILANDFNEDLSYKKAQDFIDLPVDEKLTEFKRLHAKYLGKYKYMYFLPQSGIHKLKFEKDECYTRYLHNDAINYEYSYGDELEKQSPYYVKKYRKSLESDNDALIYRYKRLYLAVQRNKWAMNQNRNYFQNYRMDE